MLKNSSPLISVLLACEIAGVGLDTSEEPGLVEGGQDFALESELSERVMLAIVFDLERLEFLVKTSATPAEEELLRAATLALSLNHPGAVSDRFSLDLESSAITFTRRLKSAEIDLAELAFAIRTATEVGLALADARFPEILTEDEPSESMDGAADGMVRG
jgi:hypothetical protein